MDNINIAAYGSCTFVVPLLSIIHNFCVDIRTCLVAIALLSPTPYPHQQLLQRISSE